MEATHFLNLKYFRYFIIRFSCFFYCTSAGILIAKLMNKVDKKNPVNPLIGSAGVSAVPMAARVSSKVGQESILRTSY